MIKRINKNTFSVNGTKVSAKKDGALQVGEYTFRSAGVAFGHHTKGFRRKIRKALRKFGFAGLAGQPSVGPRIAA